METEQIHLGAMIVSFALVYVVFGLYVPDDVYLGVSAIGAAILGGAIIVGSYTETRGSHEQE